ncbi:MAG: (2Fe-2S)-binding protein [Planctomycetota bacterium]
MSESHADDKMLCYCRNVPYGRVREVIDAGARTVPEIMRACDAGTGCRSCHFDIEALIVERREARRSEGGFFARLRRRWRRNRR